VRVERPATGGAVAHDEGKVIFVRHALANELVDVEVTESGASFDRGDAVTIRESSPERVAPPCPYAHPGGCGGCDLQHATDQAQRDWKASIVNEQLRRVAHVERDVVVRAAPSAPRGSRTRLRCAVDERGRLSLRRSRSHELVALASCWIADERFLPAFTTTWKGLEEVELRALSNDEPFAVATRSTERGTRQELRALSGAALAPTTRSRVRVGENVFTVGPQSFWQSHRDAPTLLSELVLSYADVAPGDEVVDLFSGVGLFALPLAQAVGRAGRVTAVESSSFAVRDARENAAGLSQLRVREWKVSARSVNDTVNEGAVVVLDPPRQGLARGVVASLIRRAPRRVVYVSCDAATFARDLRNFLEGGFTLTALDVLDLFPMTEHVELVALLDNRG